MRVTVGHHADIWLFMLTPGISHGVNLNHFFITSSTVQLVSSDNTNMWLPWFFASPGWGKMGDLRTIGRGWTCRYPHVVCGVQEYSLSTGWVLRRPVMKSSLQFALQHKLWFFCMRLSVHYVLFWKSDITVMLFTIIIPV